MSYDNYIKNSFGFNKEDNNFKCEFKNESEIISRYIIDKIISLVISKNMMHEIFENNVYYYFEYLKKILTPLIKVNNMKYDTDNYIENDIKEPRKIIKDSFLSELIKTDFIYRDKKSIKEINENKIKTPKHSYKKSFNKFSDYMNIINSRESTEKEIKKKRTKTNYESFSIKDIHKKEEPKEIQILREQYENALKAKMERLSIKQNNKLRKSIFNDKSNLKKNINLPIIDSEKYTFDSNGKIMFLRSNNFIDLIKEFNEIFPKTKFIKVKEKEDNFYFPEKEKDTIQIEKYSEKISILNEMINESKKTSNNQNNKVKLRRTRTKIFPVKEREKVQNIRCPPSGDNFSYIKPEIGVLIKSNDGNEKGGNLQYSKLYNRYSTNEYNNILEETININKNKVKCQSKNINQDFDNKNFEENNSNNNFDDNNTLFSSSFIGSNNKVKNDLLNKEKTLFSDKAYSCKHIILNKSILNNSSLLDSVDDYNKSYDIDKLSFLRKNESTKNFFMKKINLSMRNNGNFSSKGKKTYDEVDKFNLNLLKKKSIINPYIHKKKNQSLPELKPILPKYNKLEKRNGIWVKSELPLRINFNKNE